MTDRLVDLVGCERLRLQLLYNPCEFMDKCARSDFGSDCPEDKDDCTYRIVAYRIGMVPLSETMKVYDEEEEL